jgi:polysaccharide export outer membrane protein
MGRIGHYGRVKLSVTIFLLALMVLQVAALEYLMGPDDVIRITFWQQPDLDTTTRIRQDGKISLPVLGELEVVGLSPRELEEEIVRDISVYSKEISQVRVEVVEYNSRKIFVTGEIYRPGKYTFEFIPNLWEVLREAGGPTERAMLSEISIIHADDTAGEKITVNLAQALETGDFSKLSILKPGDTVIVPSYSMEGVAAPADLLGRSVVFVYGQVARPGVYHIEEESTLLEVITLAGGPTAEANLKDVRVLMKHGSRSNVARVNLEKHLRLGDPPDFPLRPSDTVVVPQKAGIWRGVWSGITSTVGITSTIFSIIFIVDRISE